MPNVPPVGGIANLSGAFGETAQTPELIDQSTLLPADQTFNVKLLGAKGDGVTDDTVAIQSALTSAGTTPNGKVYFPAGTYLVNTTYSTANMAPIGLTKYSLLVPSNVTVYGDGSDTSLIKSTLVISAGTRTVFANSNVTNLTQLNAIGNANITFKDLGIQVSAPSPPNFDLAFWGIGVTGFVMSGCVITYGMLQANATPATTNTVNVNGTGLNNQWLVVNNTFIGGAEALAFYQGMHLVFANNYVSQSMDSSISINSSGEQIVIADNVIDRAPKTTRALGCIEVTNDLAGDAHGIQDVTITGNVCLNNVSNGAGGSGINCQGISNTTITGNVVRNPDASGIVVHGASASVGSQDVIVADNVVRLSNTASGSAISIANDGPHQRLSIIGNDLATANLLGSCVATGGGGSNLQNILITGNVMSGNAGSNGIGLGASLTAGTYGLIEGNILYGFGAATVFSGAGTGWIKRNNPGFNPVGVEAPGVPATGVLFGLVDHDRTYYITAAAGGSTTVVISNGPSIVIPANAVVPVRIPAQVNFSLTYGVNTPAWVVEGE